ncbi:sarcosine oxidase subunit gamma [Marinomonas sp. GJ51-6]|uniref:sarcosine oxidase subunit gamma n=1 Tax=Marinomonas sp. GJ51-6 TaxID=2992802 RepID=UPI002934BBC9|nr:sarcosine oxidase subunit gamma [Marinomonas sp. GJ51-6]WOD07538.1 sarcosine oxidase subunit gamma [Marinomonas sp. GJ51-6]
MAEFIVSESAESRQSQIFSLLPSGYQSSIQLKDSTTKSRVGFRGVGVEAFLTSQGVNFPSAPNQAILSEAGLWVLRLSKTEFWLVDLTGELSNSIFLLEQLSQGLADVYRLYCQHSHGMFEISGALGSQMFAKVCGVDLSHDKLAAGSIAQTSIARVNGIIVNVSASDSVSDRYLLCSDVSSSQHLWDALIDAAQEF